MIMENTIYDFCERDGFNSIPISPGFTPFPSGDHPGSGRKWYRKAAHRITPKDKHIDVHSVGLEQSIMTVKLTSYVVGFVVQICF
ncbi:hypothetical protein C0J52_09312 [Blattella germanica]|nr:hypothetical protein C0J52_09312 [Blattella germanica]